MKNNIPRWLCDDLDQGITHRCIYWGGGVCYGIREKPNCPKRHENPKWVLVSSGDNRLYDS